eukprot:6205718-Pleurochrysis_carterae.AAC.7
MHARSRKVRKAAPAFGKDLGYSDVATVFASSQRRWPRSGGSARKQQVSTRSRRNNFTMVSKCLKLHVENLHRFHAGKQQRLAYVREGAKQRCRRARTTSAHVVILRPSKTLMSRLVLPQLSAAAESICSSRAARAWIRGGAWRTAQHAR